MSSTKSRFNCCQCACRNVSLDICVQLEVFAAQLENLWGDEHSVWHGLEGKSKAGLVWGNEILTHKPLDSQGRSWAYQLNHIGYVVRKECTLPSDGRMQRQLPPHTQEVRLRDTATVDWCLQDERGCSNISCSYVTLWRTDDWDMVPIS